MKEIKAVFHTYMLEKVLDALHELPHFPGVTIIDVTGEGRGLGQHHAYEPTFDELSAPKRKLIEIVCADNVANEIAEVIRKAGRTGCRGDGIIVITNIEEVIRIHTGEHQEDAV